MSDGRPKRQVTVPRKYTTEEGYILPDSPRESPGRRVLRFLKTADLEKDLQNAKVYVVWPDDNLWYEATIQETPSEDMNAKLFYTDTEEEEDVNLTELINDKHIAFLEIRPGEYQLKEDELPADDLIQSGSAHTASGSEAMEEESEGDATGEATSSLKRKQSEIEEEHLLTMTDAGLMNYVDTSGMTMSGENSGASSVIGGGVRKSENPLLETLRSQGSSILASLPSVPSASSRSDRKDSTFDLVERKRQLQESLLKSTSFEVSTPKITALREKTIENFKSALEIARTEREKQAEETKPPEEINDDRLKEIATDIEDEILKLCGGENQDYKKKFRSLYFNLKDSRNPELRGRVLEGEISAERLVTMTPQELASQELSRWRQRTAQEMLKATVLDEEAAAKFSTAAALKQLDSKREQRLEEEIRDSGVVADIPDRSPVRQADSEPKDENEIQTRLSPGVSRLDDNSTTAFDQDVLSATIVNVKPSSSQSFPQESIESMQKTEDVEEQESTHKIEYVPGETVETMDIEGVPDWAEDVLDDPSESAFIEATTRENTTIPLVLYSPEAADDRNDSAFGPVPIESRPQSATANELTPLILKGENTDEYGDIVWEGQITMGDHHSFRAQCQAVAGKCSLREILSSTQLTVQGRMNLKRVEDFLEKLRMSKSRSVTIGILKPPPNASESDLSSFQEQVSYHLNRERTCAMNLGEGAEGYLIAQCALTERLLLTAQKLLENECVAKNVKLSEFLLVVVHKKDWTSRKSALNVPPPPPPPLPQTTVPETTTIVSDPRLKAGIKPILEKKEQPLLPTPMAASMSSECQLPAGLTLESISSLAAMLGVSNHPKSQPIQQSVVMPSQQLMIPPHQMNVPGPSTTASFSLPVENQQQQIPMTGLQIPPTQQQQQQVERPKFLMFDPVTNKAVPLNPASVQYDPVSNRVMMTGPLPPGFSIPPTAAATVNTPNVELPGSNESFLTAPQVGSTVLPMMNKPRQNDGLTETLMEDVGSFPSSGAVSRLQSANMGIGMLGRLGKSNPQPMTSVSTLRGHNSVGFRRGRGNGRFDHAFASSNLHATSPMQSFPASDAL